VSYTKTRDALRTYDAEPTSGNADLVVMAFWLETDTRHRAALVNPSVDQVRAALVIDAQHEWQFYANGSFCRKCGASIGSTRECLS